MGSFHHFFTEANDLSSIQHEQGKEWAGKPKPILNQGKMSDCSTS